MYLRSANTFNFVGKLKSFRFKNKTILLSFRKHFRSHMFCKEKYIRYFRLKNIYFLLGNTFTFVSETLRKTNPKQNRISFVVVAHVCHLHHNHHSPCAQSTRFPWPKRYHSLTLSHKLYVLCHKSLKDIFSRIGYHDKERLRLVYTYAQYDRELLKPDIDTGESPNQAFSSGKTGPQRGGGTHGSRQEKLMRFV